MVTIADLESVTPSNNKKSLFHLLNVKKNEELSIELLSMSSDDVLVTTNWHSNSPCFFVRSQLDFMVYTDRDKNITRIIAEPDRPQPVGHPMQSGVEVLGKTTRNAHCLSQVRWNEVNGANVARIALRATFPRISRPTFQTAMQNIIEYCIQV